MSCQCRVRRSYRDGPAPGAADRGDPATDRRGDAGADLAPAPAWTAPRFDPATLVGVGLPLFLVTMASQNVPGMAVLAAHGYRPRPEPVADAR